MGAARRQAESTVGIRLLALGFFGGILLLYALPALPPSWLFGVLPLPLLIRWPGKWVYLAIILGFCWAWWDAAERLEARWPTARHGELHWVTGHIDSLPEVSDGSLRFQFQTASQSQTVRVSWYEPEAMPQAGECWRLQLKMRAPRGLSNPGGFDYEAWLFREGIDATAYIREAQRCSPDEVWSLDAWRQRLSDTIRSAMDGSTAAGLMLALAVGDRNLIQDEQWAVFRHTGTSHLVAISGLHIGIVAGFVFFLLRWLWGQWPAASRLLAAQRAAAVGAGAAAFVYACMAGLALPTQRALIMLLVLLGALWWGRQTAPSRLLALALLAVLLFDPAAVLAPGFWLSFGAVAWIIYIFAGRLGRPGRLGEWAWLQLSLALALAPLTLFWFSETSLVAPLANLVMVPLFFLLVPWVLCSVLLLWVPVLGPGMLALAGYVLTGAFAGLAWLDGFAWAYWARPEPGFLAALCACLGVALLLAPRGLPARWLGLVFLLPILWVKSDPPSPGGFELTALDVGQGLAVVVRTANHTLLYDAGPAYRGGFNAGEQIVAPYLRHLGVGQLDALMLSHGDFDHAGGVEALRAEFHPQREIGTEQGEPCRAGVRWQWDEVQFRALHPPIGQGLTGNNASCVLQIKTGDYAALLPGDIERKAETLLVESIGEALDAEVLLVPHHGSATSSSTAFIEAVSPQLAIVPAGWRNRWDFPRPTVTGRYTRRDIPVITTGQAGAVILRVDAGKGLAELRSWRAQSPKLWRVD